MQCKDAATTFGTDNCKSCHPLSERYNKQPTSGSCGKRKPLLNISSNKILVEYLDLTKINANIELENEYHISSTGYTLGFWFFSSDKDFSTKVFRIMYEDNLMITVTTDTDTFLYAHCFIGLEYYDIVGKTDTSANLATLTAAADEIAGLNFKKSAKVDEMKWRYIRCGYSYSSMKFYVDVNYEGFPASNLTEETLKLPTYLKTDTMKLPPRKFYASNPKLTISTLTGLSNKYVFVRNISLFADYIHPNIYFHYQ